MGEVTVPDFEVVAENSAIVVEAESTVGPIAWRVDAPRGRFQAEVVDGVVSLDPPPTGVLEIDIDRLTSGNAVYDAELRKRVDARRFPRAEVELTGRVHRLGDAFGAQGLLTFHGVQRPVSGTFSVETGTNGSLIVAGRQQVDIRAFGIPAPSMLMLKIYPDVTVHLLVEGRPITD